MIPMYKKSAAWKETNQDLSINRQTKRKKKGVFTARRIMEGWITSEGKQTILSQKPNEGKERGGGGRVIPNYKGGRKESLERIL